MIVITGATSGIGAALARDYARGGAHLALTGRDPARLEGIAAECRALGAPEVETAALDVRDRERVGGWLLECARRQPIDLVIANAGVMAGTLPGAPIEPADAGHRVAEINVLGVLNTLQPILPGMIARGSGQIAIVSSIAGFTPIADAPSYAASKAAVLSYGLSLRAALRRHGIKVSVVCPGYVATPMTAQIDGEKPGQITAEEASRRIRGGLARDRAVIAFPFFIAWLTRLGGMLPDGLRRWSARNFRFTVANRE
jgi:short-subunit dehydrogenase